MKPALKTILAAGMLLFLGLHFTSLLIYTAPLQTGGKLKAASVRYCYPYFHQQWTVFVPAPDRQYNLYRRSWENGRWQAWRHISDEMIDKVRSNPFAGNETEQLLLSNSMGYLFSDPGELNRVFEEEPTFAAFAVLKRAAGHYDINGSRCNDVKRFELLLTKTTNTNTTAYYFKNLSL